MYHLDWERRGKAYEGDREAVVRETRLDRKEYKQRECCQAIKEARAHILFTFFSYRDVICNLNNS